MAGPNVKTDWYQTENAVVVTVLYKGLKNDQVNIQFLENSLEVNLNISNEVVHNLKFDLPHKIDPEQCSYKVMSTKVEIKLKKVEGIQWKKLEGNADAECIKTIPQSSTSDKPPTYPTSKGTNWTAIEKEILAQEANEKPEGEEALNQLFQGIYGKGSDEVKKAMVKSYVESGGTVLSTNWSEISKQKVEVKPPDGMEYKKWDT